MGNIKIIPANLIDNMTLTVTPAPVAGLGQDNLKNNLRSRLLRVTGTTATIDGDGIGGAVDGFALAQHNLTGDSSIRLRLYDGANQTGSVVYDSGIITFATITPWGSFTWGLEPWASSIPNSDLSQTYALWFATVIGLSFSCEITAPQNSEIEIARLFIGKSFQPRNNYSYGGGIGWVEPSRTTRTDGGSLHVEAVEKFRRVRISLDWLDTGDRDLFSRLLRRAGKTGDLLIALDPDAIDNIGVEETLVCKRISDVDLFKSRNTFNKIQLELVEI